MNKRRDATFLFTLHLWGPQNDITKTNHHTPSSSSSLQHIVHRQYNSLLRLYKGTYTLSTTNGTHISPTMQEQDPFQGEEGEEEYDILAPTLVAKLAVSSEVSQLDMELTLFLRSMESRCRTRKSLLRPGYTLSKLSHSPRRSSCAPSKASQRPKPIRFSQRVCRCALLY